MTIRYQQPREGLVIATATGELEDRDFVEHRRALVVEKRFGDPVDLLFDLRGVDAHSVTTLGIRSLATSAPKNHPVRHLALVANGDVMYGYARMYQSLATSPHRLHVCRTLEEAEAWLASPDALSSEDDERSRRQSDTEAAEAKAADAEAPAADPRHSINQ